VEPKIIFEDKDFLIVDKPAGVIVNDAETTKGKLTLQSWLSTLDYPLAKSKEERGGIVHRLDKETSGILIVAKTREAFNSLQREFKERSVEKIYIALVHGKVEPEKGTIEVSVGRLPWRRDRFGVLPGGREARTDYEVISFYKKDGEEYSLVEVKPKTGRTHQIRIHFKYLRYPLVSDSFYAGRKTARKDRTWCPRLFLHASRIKFKHPTTGKEVTFETSLPADLAGVLDLLSSSES
jgi:23S rRNA pseudouridine1911/1915/1917 synthase